MLIVMSYSVFMVMVVCPKGFCMNWGRWNFVFVLCRWYLWRRINQMTDQCGSWETGNSLRQRPDELRMWTCWWQQRKTDEKGITKVFVQTSPYFSLQQSVGPAHTGACSHAAGVSWKKSSAYNSAVTGSSTVSPLSYRQKAQASVFLLSGHRATAFKKMCVCVLIRIKAVQAARDTESPAQHPQWESRSHKQVFACCGQHFQSKSHH